MEIKGGDAFSYVVFSLKPGETIKADGGTMMYMKGDVELDGVKSDGASSFFGRIFSGESAFLSLFKGGAKGGKVSFAGIMPGSMTSVNLKGNGANIVVTRKGFVCCDEQVKVGGKTNLRGLIEIGQEEGFVLTRAYLPEGVTSGRVWISSFGTHERHVLADGEILKVNNGMFLASNITYTLEKAGKTLTSSLFSGEGFMMKFVGPGVVYTQSRNFNEFSRIIEQRAANNSDNSGPAFEVNCEGGAGARRGKLLRGGAKEGKAETNWVKAGVMAVLGAGAAAIGSLYPV